MKINSNKFILPLLRILRNSSGSTQGFTLVELIVVCTILGVLATMATAGFSDFKDKTRIARCAEEIRGLEKDIIAYAAERGNYPPLLTDANSASLTDPWGRPYVYSLTLNRRFGQVLNTDFDLYSTGVDGITAPDGSIVRDGGEDDVLRANDGGFAGSASFYGT